MSANKAFRQTEFDTVNKVVRYLDNGDTVNPADRAKVTRPFRNLPVLNGKAPTAPIRMTSKAEIEQRAAVDRHKNYPGLFANPNPPTAPKTDKTTIYAGAGLLVAAVAAWFYFRG